MIIRRFEKSDLISYEYNSLDELKSILDKWKDDFRAVNKTDEVIKMCGIDKSYEKYCMELDKIIEETQDFMNDNCSKCKTEDHESNGFCRCEKRNIQRAKYLREIHKSPWQKVNKGENNVNYCPERSKREDHESGCGALNSGNK